MRRRFSGLNLRNLLLGRNRSSNAVPNLAQVPQTAPVLSLPHGGGGSRGDVTVIDMPSQPGVQELLQNPEVRPLVTHHHHHHHHHHHATHHVLGDVNADHEVGEGDICLEGCLMPLIKGRFIEHMKHEFLPNTEHEKMFWFGNARLLQYIIQVMVLMLAFYFAIVLAACARAVLVAVAYIPFAFIFCFVVILFLLPATIYNFSVIVNVGEFSTLNIIREVVNKYHRHHHGHHHGHGHG